MRWLYFRSLIISRMVALEDEETIREAQRRFENHVSGKSILSADLRSSVYRAVLSVGSSDTFETMLELYRKSDLHEEKNRILGALGATRDEAVLRRALEFSMGDEVRAQDTVFAIMSVTMTYKGRLIAWEFLKENWASLVDRYEGGFLLLKFVKFTTENFVSETLADEIEEFFAKHPTPGVGRTVQQSVETVRLNVAWLKRDQASIQEFLKISR